MEDNIKTDVKTGGGGVEWTYLVKYRVYCGVIGNTVMNLRVTYKNAQKFWPGGYL
jgi:hypothetical protein